MLTGLLKASHLVAVEQIPDLVTRYAREAGLDEVLIYLTDLQQTVLRLLTGRGADGREGADAEIAELKIDTTLAGRAYQDVRVLLANGALLHCYVPNDGTALEPSSGDPVSVHLPASCLRVLEP